MNFFSTLTQPDRAFNLRRRVIFDNLFQNTVIIYSIKIFWKYWTKSFDQGIHDKDLYSEIATTLKYLFLMADTDKIIDNFRLLSFKNRSKAYCLCPPGVRKVKQCNVTSKDAWLRKKERIFLSSLNPSGCIVCYAFFYCFFFFFFSFYFFFFIFFFSVFIGAS